MQQPKPIIFTQKGLQEKQKEYQNFLQKRPEAVKELAKAREMGDLSENGYYKAARMNLSDIDRNLRHLKHVLKVAKVQQRSTDGTIDVGSMVTFLVNGEEKTYQLVGTFESNPSQGKISLYSPLGKALTGKRAGDTVELVLPSGKTQYVIKNVT